MERLAPLTGSTVATARKRGSFRFEPDKFTAAGLCGLGPELVQPSVSFISRPLVPLAPVRGCRDGVKIGR